MAEAKPLPAMSRSSADAYEDIAEVEFARGRFPDAIRDDMENAERREQGVPIQLGSADLFAVVDGLALMEGW